jgi:hypothetical protein
MNKDGKQSILATATPSSSAQPSIYAIAARPPDAHVHMLQPEEAPEPDTLGWSLYLCL